MLARVFPTKTRFTPDDELCFFDHPDLLTPRDITEVHISTLFTWDLQKANALADSWSRIAPVKIGGPALGLPSNDFTPNLYVKSPAVITSRGCHNKCWFCSVWHREKKLKELPICCGTTILDDNILACSNEHIRKVFEMLRQQKGRVNFTGGLEAKLLTDFHIDLLVGIKTKVNELFFAYDTPDDFAPLVEAASKMKSVGFNRTKLYCYVLCGFPRDTLPKANDRCEAVKQLGVTPFAMVWRDESGNKNKDWGKFQRSWCRPAAIWSKNRVNVLTGAIEPNHPR